VIAFVKRLWAAAPVATVILGLALVATGFFAVRMVAFSIYWHDPAHRQQQIAGWMTPGYVANSWHVPREVVLEAIDAPRNPGHPLNLADIAAMQGKTADEVIAEAQAAIAEFRANDPHGHPPPPADPAPPQGAGQ